jgi:hypothetical protein
MTQNFSIKKILIGKGVLINTLNMFTRLKCERLYNEAVFEGGYEEIAQN